MRNSPGNKTAGTGAFAVLVAMMIFSAGCPGPAPIPAAATQAVTGTAPAPVITEPVTAHSASTATAPATGTATPADTLEAGIANATVPVTGAVTVTPVAIAETNPSASGGTGDNDTASRYDDPPATLAVEGVTGSLLIHVAAGSGDGMTAYIARNGTNVPPLDTSPDSSRSLAGVQNPYYLHVAIHRDGNSDIVNLMPGSYLAILPGRSSDTVEQQQFTINPRYLTYVTFAGHPVGSSGGCGC